MEWKKVEGYTNYSINKNGEIRNDKTERILKTFDGNTGYKLVTLCENGIKRTYLAHRILGKGFIANPNNYEYIDHKNGIKTDNRIQNLRWCNPSQNMRNVKKKPNTSSYYKGVHLNKKTSRWHTSCRLNGIKKYIGSFETEEEAAKAYNRFVVENNLDDFCILNIV
jgi:hypothetical protein